jgi:2-oxoglutarate ferredoxin oxidoreductase subunit gamma
MEKRIIVAGSGGQGILFLGKLIAYAAMLENKEVTWFPAYGAEMRGGTANCTVIVSGEMIGSPVIRNPDMLIAMNEASYNRFSEKLLPHGLLIYDSSLFNPGKKRKDIRNMGIPASKEASSFKSTKSANMVMMGALLSATGILSVDSALKALDETMPDHRRNSIGINKDLIMKGYEYFENP